MIESLSSREIPAGASDKSMGADKSKKQCGGAAVEMVCPEQACQELLSVVECPAELDSIGSGVRQLIGLHDFLQHCPEIIA